MHLGRRYKLTELLVWTRWESVYLFAWSLFATALLEVLHWHFLSMPAPHPDHRRHSGGNRRRLQEPAMLCAGQRGPRVVGADLRDQLHLGEQAHDCGNPCRSGLPMKELFYRHFAWLTSLRFFLREGRVWENAGERGNVRFLAGLHTPESKSVLKDELATCLSEAELQKMLTHRGDKEALILSWQFQAVGDLHSQGPDRRLDILHAVERARRPRPTAGGHQTNKELSVCAELLFDHRPSGDCLRRNCPVRSLSLFS